MPRRFEQGLAEAKEMILAMGAGADDMIRDAMAALVDRKTELVEPVLRKEEDMDRLQKEIDNLTVNLIATFTPVAANLRFLLMVARINTDLERIGDQAVNICEDIRFLIREPPLKPLVDLPRMAQIAREMLKGALDSFQKETDANLVDIIQRDREVDELYNQIFRELLTYMLDDPKTINRSLGLILVARAIERVADHATNISEEIIFLVRGEDIRHT